jgi:hypothetical protein
MMNSQILKGLLVLSALTLVTPVQAVDNATPNTEAATVKKTHQLKTLTVSHVQDAMQTVSRHFAIRSRF